MFFSSGAAILLLMNKKHEPIEYKIDIKYAEEELKKKMNKMSDIRLKYIGWRNKIRGLFLMRQLTEYDAHEILTSPSDVFDTIVGYCSLNDDVARLKIIASDPENIARGYYIRIA